MRNTASLEFYRLLLALASLSLLASCSTPVANNSAASVTNTAAQRQSGSCSYDRAKLLSLNIAEFDQDPNGGWRTITQQPGCFAVAADLIRDYHAALPEKSFLLYWHEGQVRAINGEIDGATQLFEMSYNPLDDIIGWNIYVDATLAFMKQDRTALVKAYLALVDLPLPANTQLDRNGNSLADSWPPNIKVVESLIACFGQEYRVAYQNCRS